MDHCRGCLRRDPAGLLEAGGDGGAAHRSAGRAGHPARHADHRRAGRTDLRRRGHRDPRPGRRHPPRHPLQGRQHHQEGGSSLHHRPARAGGEGRAGPGRAGFGQDAAGQGGVRRASLPPARRDARRQPGRPRLGGGRGRGGARPGGRRRGVAPVGAHLARVHAHHVAHRRSHWHDAGEGRRLCRAVPQSARAQHGVERGLGAGALLHHRARIRRATTISSCCWPTDPSTRTRAVSTSPTGRSIRRPAPCACRRLSPIRIGCFGPDSTRA